MVKEEVKCAGGDSCQEQRLDLKNALFLGQEIDKVNDSEAGREGKKTLAGKPEQGNIQTKVQTKDGPE